MTHEKHPSSAARYPRAFPSTSIDARYGGMSLRDWFAGQALAGLLADPTTQPGRTIDAHAEHFAAVAGIYADAMMAERDAKRGEAEA